MARLITGMAAAGILASCAAEADSGRDALVRLFDQRYLAGELPPAANSRQASYARAMREDGFVSWGYGDWLNALDTMYEATGDDRYGEAALALIRLALANRDDRLGRESPQAPRPLPGWGERHYLPVRADTLTNTGLVIWPAMRFANIARAKDGRVWRENRDFIATIPLLTRQSFDAFAGDLVTQRRNGLTIAYYAESRTLAPVLAALDCAVKPDVAPDAAAKRKNCRFSRDNAGRPLPFNMSLIMGSYAIELLKWQGDQAERKLATIVLGMFNHLVIDGRLKPNPADPQAWQWQYMADGYSQEGVPDRTGHIEDIAHGAIDIAFLTALHGAYPALRKVTTMRLAMPLDDRLMQGFARAFAGPMTRQGADGTVLAQYVNGQYPGQGAANSRCSTWIRLARWDPAVASTCAGLMLKPGDPPTLDPANASPLGLAELVAAPVGGR